MVSQKLLGTLRPTVGVVVNYYCKDGELDSRYVLLDCTKLGLRFLSFSEDVSTILLVDGSREADPVLQKSCEELSVKYLHCGKELSYVESYNIGWRTLNEDIIALMANDILPFPIESIGVLRDFLMKPGIGCVFPYLSSTRQFNDEVQQRGFINRGSITCEPSSMTLNLNLFKKQVLEEIDGLDENYLFGFQEPILLSKIRNLGWKAVLVGNTHAFHCEELTKILGASSLTYEHYKDDIERWFNEFTDYASQRGVSNIALSKTPFSRSLIVKQLWRLSESLPFKKIREFISTYLVWIEPWITRYPCKQGKDFETCSDRDYIAKLTIKRTKFKLD